MDGRTDGWMNGWMDGSYQATYPYDCKIDSGSGQRMRPEGSQAGEIKSGNAAALYRVGRVGMQASLQPLPRPPVLITYSVRFCVL